MGYSPSPIVTGDIVKGSPTIDPDGFPLVYFGSRDNHLRVVALDRGAVVRDQSHGVYENVPPLADLLGEPEPE